MFAARLSRTLSSSVRTFTSSSKNSLGSIKHSKQDWNNSSSYFSGATSSSWGKTALLGLPLLAAVPVYDKLKNKDDKKIDDLVDASKSVSTRAVDASTYALQSKSPIRAITTHLSGIRASVDDKDQQIATHYYLTRLSDDFCQGLLYDSDESDAKLVGVEYIISEKLYESLPQSEKESWHSHSYEVSSGILSAPELPSRVERKLVEQLAPMYSKTYYFWDTERDPLPYGEAQLMSPITREGIVNQELLSRRDSAYGINPEFERKYRSSIKYPERPSTLWTEGSRTQKRSSRAGKDESNDDSDDHEMTNTEAAIEKGKAKAQEWAHELSGAAVVAGSTLLGKASELLSSAKDKISDYADEHKDEYIETAKDVKDKVVANTAQAFKEDGVIGRQFTEKGAIGGTAQKLGGAFDKDGAVGKQFKADGAVGGAVQSKAEDIEEDAEENVQSAKDIKKSAKRSAKDAKESAKGAAKDTKDAVKGAAKDAKESAKDAARDTKDSVKGAAKDAKESAKGAYRDAKDAAKGARDEAGDAKKKTAQAFKEDGAIGKQFTEKGAIGGTAQKIGGPFDKEGAIGKQFTKDGAIGGKVQEKAEEVESDSSSMSDYKNAAIKKGTQLKDAAYQKEQELESKVRGSSMYHKGEELLESAETKLKNAKDAVVGKAKDASNAVESKGRDVQQSGQRHAMSANNSVRVGDSGRDQKNQALQSAKDKMASTTDKNEAKKGTSQDPNPAPESTHDVGRAIKDTLGGLTGMGTVGWRPKGDKMEAAYDSIKSGNMAVDQSKDASDTKSSGQQNNVSAKDYTDKQTPVKRS